MTDLDKAVATQLANIEKRTGKTLAELTALVHASGLQKHGELVTMLKTTLGMGHGDANTVVHLAKSAAAPSVSPASDDEVLAGLYVGAKAALRPIHDRLLDVLRSFGDFETAPKKGYVSYRRKKQFVMIGPATNTRIEVGLNVKELPDDPRLQALPTGQMCNYRVRLGDVQDVDAALSGWMRKAYESAG